MSGNDVEIRPVRPDDDFERMEQLYYHTHVEKKMKEMAKNNISYRRTNWREQLFPESDATGPAVLKSLSTKGFVVVRGNEMESFMTVGISSVTHNGYIEYGYNTGGEQYLSALIVQCEHAVKIAGGSRLYQTTGMKLGQIRNDAITFMEAHGFRSDSFYHVFVNHAQLDSWQPPDDLELSYIRPASVKEADQIAGILDEDQEFFLAEEFRGNFSSRTPNHVFLCLYDDNGQEIKGIAYYKVWEQSGGAIVTVGLGFHFRPKYEVSKQEARRFIQATLASMKQLGATRAWARVSSQNFNTILVMAAEGFDLAPNHIVMMVKAV